MLMDIMIALTRQNVAINVGIMKMDQCIETLTKGIKNGWRCGAHAKHEGYCAAHFAPIAAERIRILEDNLMLMAKLAKGGQFYNPIVVWEAKKLRDEILKNNGSVSSVG